MVTCFITTQAPYHGLRGQPLDGALRVLDRTLRVIEDRLEDRHAVLVELYLGGAEAAFLARLGDVYCPAITSISSPCRAVAGAACPGHRLRDVLEYEMVRADQIAVDLEAPHRAAHVLGIGIVGRRILVCGTGRRPLAMASVSTWKNAPRNEAD
ncbi:hypothetical protein NLN62_50725 (plasmid) [Bradyrhizobium sp. CCGUVB23]|nr:hypothetical protein [Bradyrhizobium sp. CCGUVB23]MCP3468385.1 hypothetical protein [Bradyrhizobium sp. CCGUVB23]